jgi:sorting and assembly machinery component 37
VTSSSLAPGGLAAPGRTLTLRPSSLDLALFSQLTLVLSTNLPNPLLSNLLRETYPVLVAHHDAVLSAVFPAAGAPCSALLPPQPSLVR